MIDKIISPIGFPLVLVVIFWFSERNKSSEHKADRAKMRFGQGFVVLWPGEDAVAWRKEIERAGQDYPNLALLMTCNCRRYVRGNWSAAQFPRQV